MANDWHGINDPGYYFKPKSKPAPADNTRVSYKTDPVPDPPKEPTPIEARLSEPKFLPPSGGLKFNDKCKAQVKVEYLRKTMMAKITFCLFCTYNGKTEEMIPDKEGFEKKGIADVEFTLFFPENYKEGDKADFFFKASHRRGEKVVESEKLTIPQASAGLSDSVGQGGKNLPEDVKKVKKKLKEFEYPVKDENDKITPEDIKAIKFFQALNKEIPHGLVTVDGKISKGGKTEKALFGKTAKKYATPKKGEIKPLEASIEKKKNDALNGTDETEKKAWTNVTKVWDDVSPYLPVGSRMESGYRSTEAQRKQLYAKYYTFKNKIIEKFDADTWEKYYTMQISKMTDEELKQSDIEMHRQICEAKSPHEVALPGKSKHEFGKAADSQLADVSARIRALLWFSIEFNGTIRNITREENDCGHFEFD
jgi:hypothetical protein